MGLTIGRYTFEGPYLGTTSIQDVPGVYAILSRRNGVYHLIDLGESSSVRTQIENHPRRNDWKQHCDGSPAFTVFYTGELEQAGRKAVAEEIRGDYNPPCDQH